MQERKILVMEDDSNINNLITEALQKEGYICTQAFSGTEGIMCIQKETFDLVILDLMLPGMTGEEWIAKIRPSMKVPIIVVSAKDELDHKIDVLTIGADDYLTKPFQIKELIVRVQVQMRRTNEGFIQSELCYKDMVIKKDTFQVFLKGEELILTRQEYKILELFLIYPNKVFRKQEIYNYAWEDYYIGEDKTIHVHISNIRQKIKKITEDDYIETVWGIGFKLYK